MDSKNSKLNQHKSTLVLKTKTHTSLTRERSSISSLQTTLSLNKDPKEFLKSRGYEVKNILAQGGFAK